MNRTSLIVLLALAMGSTIGCATKKSVRNETTPLINKTNELDDQTAKNSRSIKDVDARAQSGIQQAQARANEVDQKAQAAGKSADQAQQLASTAVQHVDALTNTVVNLDNYRPVAETSVLFGFNKDNLTKQAKEELDDLASKVQNTKGYIITLEGAADSVGDPQYNYELSQRRANSVIQYLASAHSIPAHKVYIIGIGEDKPVESNKTAAGRAKNRRVEVRLMSNINGDQAQPAQAPANNTNPSASATTPPSGH